MSKVEDFFADVEQEGKTGDDAFEGLDTEKETPSDSQTEKEPVDDEQPEEGKEDEEKSEDTPASDKEDPDDEEEKGDVPFHEHPRWIQREQEMKELREELAEAKGNKQELQEFKAKFSQYEARQPQTAPEWFRELYGENPEAWQKYSEYDQQLRTDIKDDILREQQLQQERAQQETAKWDKWVSDEVDRLEADGKDFERNELIKVMLDYKPTDDEGNFNFDKGYEIYEALKAKGGDDAPDPAKSKARKRIAASATESSGKGAKGKDYVSSAEIRRQSWHDL